MTGEPPRGVEVIRADLEHPPHQQHLLALLDLDMRHPMGAGRPFDPQLQAQLLHGLRSHPGTQFWTKPL